MCTRTCTRTDGRVEFEPPYYSEFVASLSTSCRRFAEMIQRVFRSRDADLLWTAFVAYVKPKVIYASSAWSLIFQYQIASLESIQRHFTKYLHGLTHLTHEQRLEFSKKRTHG